MNNYLVFFGCISIFFSLVPMELSREHVIPAHEAENHSRSIDAVVLNGERFYLDAPKMSLKDFVNFISTGTNINWIHPRGDTVLLRLCSAVFLGSWNDNYKKSNLVEKIKILTRAGIDIDSIYCNRTPLMILMEILHKPKEVSDMMVAVICLLVHAGARINSPCDVGNGRAAWTLFLDQLLNRCSEPRVIGWRNGTLAECYSAALKDSTDSSKWFFQRKIASMEASSLFNQLEQHAQKMKKLRHILKVFLAHADSSKIKNELIEKYRHIEFSIFFEKEPICNIIENFNNNKAALFKAIDEGNYEHTRLLLQKIPACVRQELGNTILHAAVGRKSLSLVMLIFGAAPYLINIKNAHGFNPVVLSVNCVPVLRFFMNLPDMPAEKTKKQIEEELK